MLAFMDTLWLFACRDNGVAAIEALMKRKGRFDYIVLETAGLADPGDLPLLLFSFDTLFSFNFPRAASLPHPLIPFSFPMTSSNVCIQRLVLSHISHQCIYIYIYY